jgi:hypothetical protein
MWIDVYTDMPFDNHGRDGIAVAGMHGYDQVNFPHRAISPAVSAEISSLRRNIGRQSGPLPRLAGGLPGPFLLWTARREERRLAHGVTYEPNPVMDRRNWVPTGSRPEMNVFPRNAKVPFPTPEPR